MTTVDIIQSVIIGGAATSLATEALKSPFIPVPAQKYPRLTAAVISLIAAGIATAQAGVNFTSFPDIASAVAVFAGVLIVAANTYHAVIKKS